MALTMSCLGQRAWGSYCDSLTRRPLATKIATGVIGAALGDSLAQASAHAVRRGCGEGPADFQWDAARTARLCLHTALVSTPISHTWFGFLDRSVFPTRMSHPLTALAKVVLDQALMSPIGLSLFFTSMTLLEGGGPAEVRDTLRAKFTPTIAANYMLWPAAHFINFRMVPPSQRVLYSNCVSLGWVGFLSTVVSSPALPTASEAAQEKADTSAAPSELGMELCLLASNLPPARGRMARPA